MTREVRKTSTATLIRRYPRRYYTVSIINCPVRVPQSALVYFGTPVADGDDVRLDASSPVAAGEPEQQKHGWSEADLQAALDDFLFVPVSADEPVQKKHGWSEEELQAALDEPLFVPVAAGERVQQKHGWSEEDLQAALYESMVVPDHGWSDEDLVAAFDVPMVDAETPVVCIRIPDPEREVDFVGFDLLADCYAPALLMALRYDVPDVAGHATEGALAITGHPDRGLDNEVCHVTDTWQRDARIVYPGSYDEVVGYPRVVGYTDDYEPIFARNGCDPNWL